MNPWPRRLHLISLAVALALPSAARAQVGPSPIPNQQTPAGGEQKPKGPAEEADEDESALPTTPMLPPPKNKRKKYELFELDGYFRLRGDWLKNLHLGFESDSEHGAPFPEPLGCRGDTANLPCDDTVKSTNIRLRLEPTINLTETARVFMRVDVLDNVVLGSTPNTPGFSDMTGDDPSTTPPATGLGAFTDGQEAPVAGSNYDSDSVVVKQAWAEMATALGLVRFGRMPSHWGLGILENGGGYDPFHGTYDLDSDFGDTVDRVMWGLPIPGTDLSGAVAVDWSSTRPVSAQTDLRSGRIGGQPWDIEDSDDVNDWVLVLSRLDAPVEWDERVDRGELTLNYGAYFVYRTQDWSFTPPAEFESGDAVPQDALSRRDTKAYIPDVWARLGYRNFSAELEAVGVFGSIGNLSDVEGVDDTSSYDIQKLGAVLKLGYTALEKKLGIGLELGYASGDDWENARQGITHVGGTRPLPGDNSFSAFRFDFDYEIDMILFRELIGTVTNATYVKPSVSYDITDEFKFGAQSIVSFANVPVATPGNSRLYGVEFNADVGYEGNLGKDRAFFAGLAYGVLLPLGALDHPPSVGFQDANIGDASTAHTIQSRLILRF